MTDDPARTVSHDGDIVRIDGKPVRLEFLVRDAFWADDRAVVLLDPQVFLDDPGGARRNPRGPVRNLRAYAPSGELLWEAEQPEADEVDREDHLATDRQVVAPQVVGGHRKALAVLGAVDLDHEWQTAPAHVEVDPAAGALDDDLPTRFGQPAVPAQPGEVQLTERVRAVRDVREQLSDQVRAPVVRSRPPHRRKVTRSHQPVACRRLARASSTSTARHTPPFIVTASGCAPPMPPRPAVSTTRPASVPLKWRAAHSAKVSNVPCTMPCEPM